MNFLGRSLPGMISGTVEDMLTDLDTTVAIHNDWADATVLQWFQRTLTDAGSRRRFARHDLSQDDLIICKTPEDIAAVNRVTGLQFTVL